MIKVIDRRQHDIFAYRDALLKAFFEEPQSLDENGLCNAGLNMYVRTDLFKNSLQKIVSRSIFDPTVILHSQQIECLNYLEENNLFLSAPTSFGKTFIALEFMARHDFQNVVFIIPTLALMNEISSKIYQFFPTRKYTIVTDMKQETGEKNIYVLVPERVDPSELVKIPKIDFLVFDEIYKLARTPQNTEDKRIISLNAGYFNLVDRSNKVLLLGPFINDVSFARTTLTGNITKYYSDYQPVYSKIELKSDKESFTTDFLRNAKKTMVYFSDSSSIYKFCVNHLKELPEGKSTRMAEWCKKNIDDKWIPAQMLQRGIGIHHGQLPTFLRKYVELSYNSESIKAVLCTSTLLEGINTPTQNLIVYDDEDPRLTSFRMNNLVGRVGRLKTFQEGHVFLFSKSANEKLLNENKYIDLELVAEVNEAESLAECIYLGKNESTLSFSDSIFLNDLRNNLSRFGRTLVDLKKYPQVNLANLLQFLIKQDVLRKLLKDAKDYSSNRNDDETLRKYLFTRTAIFRCLISIVPFGGSINAGLGIIDKDSPKKVSGVHLLEKLLNKKPLNIYAKIKSIVNDFRTGMSESNINNLIDVLFEISNNYIRYDFSSLISFTDILYPQDDTKNKVPSEIDYFREEFLSRIRLFNYDDDPLGRILLDFGVPSPDLPEIKKILNDADFALNSMSKILDRIKLKINLILEDSKIDPITKDLLRAMVGE